MYIQISICMYIYIYILQYIYKAASVCVEQLGRWYMMACPCYSFRTRLLVLFWLWYLWPNLKPSVLRSVVVLTSDTQDPRQKLSSVIWNDSWILICYAFCWRRVVWWEHIWPSTQMWAPWQRQVDEKAFFIHAFQREDMFLDVFCPCSVVQSLVVWFDGFHLLSGRSVSSHDSWLAPWRTVGKCEVIWYRSRITNPPWQHRWSCWLLEPWMELACGSWRSFSSGAFPGLLKLQWHALQWLASFHLSWEDSRPCSENGLRMVFERVATPTTKTGYKMVKSKGSLSASDSEHDAFSMNRSSLNVSK